MKRIKRIRRETLHSVIASIKDSFYLLVCGPVWANALEIFTHHVEDLLKALDIGSTNFMWNSPLDTSTWNTYTLWDRFTQMGYEFQIVLPNKLILLKLTHPLWKIDSKSSTGGVWISNGVAHLSSFLLCKRTTQLHSHFQCFRCKCYTDSCYNVGCKNISSHWSIEIGGLS